jgi:hypothetical protein
MAAVTFTIDPADLGLAMSTLNGIRVGFDGIASAIYEYIPTNLTKYLRERLILGTAARAGLQPSVIPLLLDPLATGRNLTTAIPDKYNEILQAVNSAKKFALSGDF